MNRRLATSIVGFLGCATPTRPPPPPPTPPTFVLELALAHDQLGVVVRNACPGTLAGTVVLTRPDGSVERVAVAPTEVTERACIAGLGGGGDCKVQPRSWVQLAPARFDAPGVYQVAGDQLALSCAPTTTRVRPLRIAVQTVGGPPIPLADGEPVPVQLPAPSAPSMPPDDALAVRKRMAATQHRATGHVEALLVPQQPVAPNARDWTTRWGTLHLPPRAPAVIIDDQRGPTWVEARATSTERPAPLLLDGKPHVVALELEDGVTGNGPKEALRAGQSGGVIANAWRIVDGALDVQAALDDGAARWRAHLARQVSVDRDLAARLDARLGARRSEFGAARPSSTVEYRPSWTPGTRELVVRYVQQRNLEARARRPQSVRVCPPNRPSSACRDVAQSPVTMIQATLAIEVVYDARGVVIRDQAHAPMFDELEQ